MGVMLIAQGAYLGRVGGTLPTWAVATLAAVSGVLLVLGFLTPIVSSLAALWSLVITVGGLSIAGILRPELGPAPLLGAVALAIVFLGPGAFSVDCRLFGRRKIVILQAPGFLRDK